MLLCGLVLPRSLSALTRPQLGLCLLVAAACSYPKPPAAWTGAQQPPVAPPPPVVMAAAAPPAPPPPPKCENLEENCTAGPDTKLFVGEVGAWFKPPEGWHYAKTPSGSITVHPDGTAWVILTPRPDASDIAPAVEVLVSERGVKGLKVDKLKRRLKKPQQSLPAAEGTIDLWEVDKGQQGEALSLADKGEGTLLVLVGTPSVEHTLIGIGFVVEAAAEAEAPKIMQAVQTLRGKP